jgi:hypothetical protein
VYVPADVGLTVKLFPEPTLLPPQLPRYHFQLAPEPSFPPLTERVDEFLRHMVDVPAIDVAATDESRIIVDLNAQTPGQLVPVAVR